MSSSNRSSRKAFRLTSGNPLSDSGFMPSPPNALNQRGYYSDIVNKDVKAAVDVVRAFWFVFQKPSNCMNCIF